MTLADFVQKHWRGLTASAGAGLVAGAVADGVRGALIGLVGGPAIYSVIAMSEKEMKENGQINAVATYLVDNEAETAADRLRDLIDGMSYLAKVQPCSEYAIDPSRFDQSRSHVTVFDRGDGFLYVESSIVGNYHDISANGLKEQVTRLLDNARHTPVPHNPNPTRVADAAKRA